MQPPVATIKCVISVPFLFLNPKSFEAALRSTPLLMDQYIEVDDQETASKDDEPTDEGIPRTSSEPEHSEVSK